MPEISAEDLLKIEKFDRYTAINKKSYKKRQATIKLKLAKYDEGVEAGVIEPVTDAEVAAAM